jgi:hypothetical protein
VGLSNFNFLPRYWIYSRAMPLHQLSPQTTLDSAEDERWLAIRRVVDSPHFRKSPRLSRLLLYLAGQTLLERTDLLTEHNIATSVFERDADFNPGVDTIVRSHMVRLRQKLDQYAAENPSAIRITVPRGEYLVRFERVALFSADLQAPPPPSSKIVPIGAESDIPSWRRQSNRLVFLCCLLGIASIVLLAVLLVVLHRSARKPADLSVGVHPLWSQLFQPRQRTTFIAADSGLVLLHRMTRKDTTLAEYLNHDYSRETHGLSPERVDEVLNMANRRYTSFVDLNIFRRLQQLPLEPSEKLEVAYARDVQMDELKQGNVILSGARGANPWLELYEPEMNFIGSNDAAHHTYSFINRHPQSGEVNEYSVSEADPKQRVLGVLAFMPNLDGNGNAVIVEGNSMAGTEAISDFLFDDAALLPFLDKLRKPGGAVPHFEVLIESNSINGSAGPFRVLACRTHS